MGSAAKSIRYTVAKLQGPQRVLLTFDSHPITRNNAEQSIADGPLGMSPRIGSLDVLYMRPSSFALQLVNQP